MKKFKSAFNVVNVTVLFALIVFLVLAVVGMINSNGVQMAGAEYMKSDNLCLDASVTAKAASKGNMVDGKNSTAAYFSSRDDAKAVIDLGQNKTFNTIILKEEGRNAKNYVLSVSGDGTNYSVVHKGDKIEYHRLATFDEVTARYIKLHILNADAPVAIKELQVYNEAARGDEFNVTAYYSNEWTALSNDPSKSEEEKRQIITEQLLSWNFDNITHLFMFCELNYNSEGGVFLGNPDDDQEKKETALKLVVDCIKENSKRGVKMFLSFGSGSHNPTFLNSIDGYKDTFIDNLIAMANRIGFDGVDIDYEFPVTDSDYALFDAFLIDLKAKMLTDMDVKQDALLSCAFGTMGINYSENARKAIDYVNVMTYDIFDEDGEHSSFWGGGTQGGHYIESVGFTKDQINLGIPFYGTQIDALMEQYIYKNMTGKDYFKNYYTVTDGLGLETLAYFNSPSMVRDKTAYALLAGYGGVMIFSATCDAPLEDEFSLWRAVNDAMAQFGGYNAYA